MNVTQIASFICKLGYFCSNNLLLCFRVRKFQQTLAKTCERFFQFLTILEKYRIWKLTTACALLPIVNTDLP